MCIKSAPYFHQKSANWALNIMLFYMLMLLTKFVQNTEIAPLEGTVSAFFLAFFSFFVSLQNNGANKRSYKGAGTKMHK